MLCYVMFLYVMLCFVILCFVMFCYVILCYVVISNVKTMMFELDIGCVTYNLIMIGDLIFDIRYKRYGL